MRGSVVRVILHDMSANGQAGAPTIEEIAAEEGVKGDGEQLELNSMKDDIWRRHPQQ